MKVRINKITPSYWRVTLDNPPLNLFDQEMSKELQNFIDVSEQNNEVKVVVFESANPDFFISHLDLLGTEQLDLKPGPTGLSPWPDVAYRMEHASFVTIGLLRGRARGVGSEFMQALDIRFASKEKAILSQIEVGMGLFPGGGGMERLPLLIGRARAMEVILSSEDFDADTAERYGWVNRSIPDSELDAFVDRFARRVASFDKKAIAASKDLINKRGSLPVKEDLKATQIGFFEALQWPESNARVASLLKKGLQQPGDLELRLGYHLGQQ